LFLLAPLVGCGKDTTAALETDEIATFLSENQEAVKQQEEVLARRAARGDEDE
jgi:hypothetical protein